MIRLKHSMGLLGCYILVSEQVALVEPKDGLTMLLSIHISKSCFESRLYDGTQGLDMHDSLF